MKSLLQNHPGQRVDGGGGRRGGGRLRFASLPRVCEPELQQRQARRLRGVVAAVWDGPHGHVRVAGRPRRRRRAWLGLTPQRRRQGRRAGGGAPRRVG